LQLTTPTLTASFAADTGRLLGVRVGAKSFALSDGPRLVFARPAATGKIEWASLREPGGDVSNTRLLAQPALASVIEVELDAPRRVPYIGFTLELSADGNTWRTIFDGTRRLGDGMRYDFPPQRVAAVRVSNLRRSDGQPIALKALRVGHTPARFPSTDPRQPTVTSGMSVDSATKQPAGWIEAQAASGLERFRWTLVADGSLRLDYSYSLEGDFVYHGITFEHPAEQITGLDWLGEGPSRVWQNRLRGSWLGQHHVTPHVLQPGEAWAYPESEGFFAGVCTATFQTKTGAMRLVNAAPEVYVRLGTPRISHPNTTVDFPSGEISFLHAIPAMGSKFKTPEQSGPSAQPAKARGRYEGSVVFRFEP
jgi:hypothetical protein